MISISSTLPPGLVDDMARNGYSSEKLTPSGGGFLRFPVDGDRNSKTAGWVKVFADDDGAIYGDFKSGDEFFWRADRTSKESEAERSARRERIDVARQAAQAEIKRLRAAARAKAQKLWHSGGLVRGDFQYLVIKGIKPFGARQLRDRLTIPVCIDGEITSLQFIGADGTKTFLTDGEVKGGYFLIEGEPTDMLCLAEGYATGCSIHEATGYSVAVCFNAGNLEPAATALRAKRPDAKFVICADNDQWTPGNPGITQAQRATRWPVPCSFYRLGEIRDRSFEQQRYRASGLNLVTAAIVLVHDARLRRDIVCRPVLRVGRTSSSSVRIGTPSAQLPIQFVNAT